MKLKVIQYRSWMILIPIILSAILISLPTASAESDNQFQRRVENVLPSPQIAFVTREQQGDNLMLIDPTNVQKLVAQYPTSRIVGLPI